VSENVKISRALVSVYDKTGILELVQFLVEQGVTVISTGGTYSLLKDNGLPVTKVSEITRFPEILGGRVKTLHPFIHGGILAKRTEEQLAELTSHQIAPIDMVVVNLYPFEKTVADPRVTLSTALENIDIGGPTMIRAAAKNFPYVAVVTDPSQYSAVISDMSENQGAVTAALRRELALAAFTRTSQYDSAIYGYLGSQQENSELPSLFRLHLKKVQDLRYGENPHQRAAFYADAQRPPAGAVAAKQLHGKELSYNNIMDMSAAIGLALEFEQPAVVIVKHSNPCGAAIAPDVAQAYSLALTTDKVSAYGGIVAANREIDRTAANLISEIFTEVVVAPAFSSEALAVLTQKKNIRLMLWPESHPPQKGMEIKAVEGGFLVQDMDLMPVNEAEWKVVSKRAPTEAEWAGMRFGWKVAKWVKSNAVIYVNANQTLGVGAGQMSRVDSSRLAVTKAAEAGLDISGSVMISDAFFPFRDGIDAAAKAGAKAVIEPGGSVRDDLVIEAANEHGMAMVFTGRRHFRH